MKINQLVFGLLVAGILAASCKKTEDDYVPANVVLNSDTVSGVWTRNSTYTVNGHLFILAGTSLTIEEGVKVIFADSSARSEFIVQGNLYCKGTETNPVLISGAEGLRTTANAMQGLWGGILCDVTCEELLLENTIIEYTGTITNESSPSVAIGLYKAESGERLPALWTSNVDGHFVIKSSVIRNIAEDCFYLEGGSIIIANNIFHTSGNSGGEAINVKSGCEVDACYNLIFSPNTNAFKLSNSDARTPQAHIVAYNNTIVNAGWRRPSVKGGSVWLEEGVYAELYNNLIANSRFGIKNKDLDADARSTYDYTYYYGQDSTCYAQFQTTTPAVVRGTNDKTGAGPGTNNPLFANYPLTNDYMNAQFDNSWDFHLQAGSPALTGGSAVDNRIWKSGITVNGVTYTSPAPSTYFGAFGAE